MIQQTFARPRWRAIFVGVSAVVFVGGLLTARPLQAQFRVALDANAALTRFESPKITEAAPAALSYPVDPRWLGQRAFGGGLRYNNPFLQLSADGVVRDGDVVDRVTGRMSALLASPAWKGLRLSMSYNTRHIPYDGAQSFHYDTTLLASSTSSWAPPPKRGPSWQTTTSADISFARNKTGLWLRATSERGAFATDSLSNWSILSGLNHQIGDVTMGVAFGGQNARVPTKSSKPVTERISVPITAPSPTIPGKLDTIGSRDSTRTKNVSGSSNAWQRWSQANVTLGWGHGRFAVDAMLSARPKMAQYQGSVWGEFSAVAALTSRVALVAATRSTPSVPGILFSEQRSASIGLRVASAALWRPTPATPIRSASSSFRVQANGIGLYTITLTVPNARSVELAGDFTSWQAVKLRQIDATRWEIALPVAPGSHRCNIRIDGADWVAPPGVPSVADEFNGRVGLFVAE